MKFFKSITTTLVLAITMLACTPEPEPPVQEYTYQGNTHQITSAHIGELNNSKILFFLSDGISVNANNNDFVGQGNSVLFRIDNNSDITGTYHYKTLPNSYNDSGITVGFSNGNNGTHEEINSGTITITPYSGGYSVVINDPVVNMTYEGDLETFNF